MTDPDTISADYTLRLSELAATLALLVEARQPTLVWGPPGTAKSMIAQQVATAAGRQYVDVRALLLDPVDLRGIPWRDGADRTRWAPPAFLPPTDDPGRWLINLEELPAAVQMVQAALYQLVLDRIDEDGSVFEPGVASFVLMPDPKARGDGTADQFREAAQRIAERIDRPIEAGIGRRHDGGDWTGKAASTEPEE